MTKFITTNNVKSNLLFTNILNITRTIHLTTIRDENNDKSRPKHQYYIWICFKALM